MIKRVTVNGTRFYDVCAILFEIEMCDIIIEKYFNRE